LFKTGRGGGVRTWATAGGLVQSFPATLNRDDEKVDDDKKLDRQ
jgi:hypothetical protein